MVGYGANRQEMLWLIWYRNDLWEMFVDLHLGVCNISPKLRNPKQTKATN